MKTSTVIGIILVVLVGIGLAVFLDLRSVAPVVPSGGTTGPTPVTGSPTPGHPATPASPNPPASTTTPQGTATVATANGGFVTVKNFLNDPAAGAYSIPGYYYLGYHIIPSKGAGEPATTTPPYLIVYLATTQYFNIELLHEPIEVTRKDAEQYLLTHLGISESQMCDLNYTVSLPWTVNATYAGYSLGFSFCPGSVKLPGE
jgi:hypothetical protein